MTQANPQTREAAPVRAYRPQGIVAVAPMALGCELSLCPPVAYERRGEVAIVRVTGPLAHHADPCMQDYGSIRATWQAALSTRPRAIVLCIHSPGGECAGMLDCATGMRADAEAAGVPSYAHTDGVCASAAYALACAMGSVSCSVGANVGSIGVIAVLQNMAAAAAAQGIETTILTSGAHKADGNPMQAMTDAARAALQAGVDALASVYFSHVAAYRGGLAAQPLEARMFVGAAAQQAGLVDAVESLDGLISRLSAAHEAQVTGAKLESYHMASNESLRAALVAAAESGDEDAKRALAAYDAKAEGDGGEDDKKKKDEVASTSAAASDEEKDEDKALTASLTSLAAQVQSQGAELAQLRAEKAANERSAFFASAGVSAEVQASLADLPLARIKAIVASLPKTAPNLASADFGAKPVTGGFGEGLTYHSAAAHDLDAQMGLTETVPGVEHGAVTLTLGVRKPKAASK